jgi:hypothetical protein
MSKRNLFFAVIVAVVFAAQFTLIALDTAYWMFQSNTPGLDDPGALVRLVAPAVLASLFWGLPVWAWGRVEGDHLGCLTRAGRSRDAVGPLPFR